MKSIEYNKRMINKLILCFAVLLLVGTASPRRCENPKEGLVPFQGLKKSLPLFEAAVLQIWRVG